MLLSIFNCVFVMLMLQLMRLIAETRIEVCLRLKVNLSIANSAIIGTTAEMGKPEKPLKKIISIASKNWSDVVNRCRKTQVT